MNGFKLITHTNNKPIVKSKKKLCVTHYEYGMFIKCDRFNIDYHYHCASCGKKLYNDTLLNKKVKNANIYTKRYICDKLVDHFIKN